jgi:cytochrome oxidase Cu insertion factor (SCO1/SenC/PrrC family)
LNLWRFDVAVPRALVTNEIQAGAKMKFAVAILFFVGLLGLSSGQQNPSSSHALATSVGLDTGQQAPAFALTDQFGHQQSNETLKGSKGIVLLFFRSADW